MTEQQKQQQREERKAKALQRDKEWNKKKGELARILAKNNDMINRSRDAYKKEHGKNVSQTFNN